MLCGGFSNILNSYIKQMPEDFDSVFIEERDVIYKNII